MIFKFWLDVCTKVKKWKLNIPVVCNSIISFVYQYFFVKEPIFICQEGGTKEGSKFPNFLRNFIFVNYDILNENHSIKGWCRSFHVSFFKKWSKVSNSAILWKLENSYNYKISSNGPHICVLEACKYLVFGPFGEIL